MKAIKVQNDDARSLIFQDADRPGPGPGEVLIEAAATAVNRADLLQRTGNYPVPEGASEILGLEVSGAIVELGEGVEGWSVGDRVCCLLSGGGYAQFVAAPAALLLPVPEHMDLVEAAAIPEVFFTAYLNIFLEADFSEGDSVLVHAGASGVGTAAIQLCRVFNSPVYATASAPKLDFLRRLGVEAAIDRRAEDFAERIGELTDHEGVDIILDPVGADYLAKNLAVLKRCGRLVIIGLLSGGTAEISLRALLMRRLRIIGSVLRSRTPAEKAQIAARFRQEVWPWFESGELEPVVDRILPIDDAGAAHDVLRRNENVGKVVLQMPGA
jgi:putative PIG3 family NAD(P)H quinone oxidoreductase